MPRLKQQYCSNQDVIISWQVMHFEKCVVWIVRCKVIRAWDTLFLELDFKRSNNKEREREKRRKSSSKINQKGKNFTSCKIKANEKTSILVSYSSFLKTSGATYLPIYCTWFFFYLKKKAENENVRRNPNICSQIYVLVYNQQEQITTSQLKKAF